MMTTRKYKAVYHVGGTTTHERSFTLNEFIEALNDKICEEIFYALDEVADDVLNLQTGESMYFKPNRDAANSKAILYRFQ